MKIPLIVALHVLLIVFLPASAHAQLRTPENVPITFYGKAVDQNGQPVTGAKVSFLLVTSHVDENRTSEKPMTLQTDGSGCFTLSGVTGYAVGQIAIEKDGYELSQKAKRGIRFGLIPDDYTPDQNNPVIFKMWKKAGKEALVNSEWHGKVACDGKLSQFDLVSGHQDAEGKLRLGCALIPSNVKWGNATLNDYKFTIVIDGGGIKETSDEFSYLAPENGYTQSIIIDEKAADPNHRNPDVEREFYVKTPQGKFGILKVHWYAWQKPPTILEWSFTLNPSGSHNLER